MDHSPARIAAYNAQRGRCLYCGNLMWERQLETKSSAAHRVWRFHRTRQYEGVTDSLTDSVCTAEHLERRVDGGSDDPSNIIAACRYCNSNRHDTPLDQWRAHLQPDQPFVRGIPFHHLVFVEAGIDRMADWLLVHHEVALDPTARWTSIHIEGLLYALIDEALIWPHAARQHGEWVPGKAVRLDGWRIIMQRPDPSLREYFGSAIR